VPRGQPDCRLAGCNSCKKMLCHKKFTGRQIATNRLDDYLLATLLQNPWGGPFQGRSWQVVKKRNSELKVLLINTPSIG